MLAIRFHGEMMTNENEKRKKEIEHLTSTIKEQMHERKRMLQLNETKRSIEIRAKPRSATYIRMCRAFNII